MIINSSGVAADGAGKNKKKRRAPAGKSRRFQPDQTKKLEEEFQKSDLLSGFRAEDLAKTTGLTKRQVQTWFTYNRSRNKRKLQMGLNSTQSR
jgi:Homeodomain